MEDWSYTFPVIKDLDGKDATITVNMAAVDPFLMYDEYTREISIYDDLKKHVGFFKFSYSLTDSHEESQEF